RLASFSEEIIVVLAPGGDVPHLSSEIRIRKVFDIFPGKGSLGGVYTGLVCSPHHYNLFAGCDMPFLNIELLRYMVNECRGYDVVIPRSGKNVEPLHAIYSKDCIPVIEKLWETGKTKVLDILEMTKVRYIEEKELDKFDPSRLSFLNVNTREDLNMAVSLLENGVEPE
ncbi:MAG: molybdenum cofactor guanylyltransferase, partial [Dehalococcoidia bacterium]|nr:molybdenum cofactor guanylyltransferase [Dehalococcoidia bacterium]